VGIRHGVCYIAARRRTPVLKSRRPTAGPEVWYTRATTGTTTKKDLPPATVRRYYHPGTTHGGGGGGFKLGATAADPNVLADNPNPERETDRALYVALVEWVV
jgi:hypothetical protein